MRFFRHVVRGSVYRDLGEVRLQASDVELLRDGTAMTLYLGEDGKRHVRASEEFHDGRFEQVLVFDPKPRP